MDIEESWNKALKSTEIIRTRILGLLTNMDTPVPYIFLSESSINLGDTIVRKGEVIVQKPALIIPPHNPQFNGFDFEKEKGLSENSLVNFLLVRGVLLPSMIYDNKTHSLDIYEGKLSDAIKHYQGLLQKQENIKTGLIAGPEDCWQFSLMIFICTQILKNADQDIKGLLNNLRVRNQDFENN